MPKITEMFAFVVADKDPNDEGIMASKSGDTWYPLVGADIERVVNLKPMADKICLRLGKTYKILRFKLDGELHL